MGNHSMQLIKQDSICCNKIIHCFAHNAIKKCYAERFGGLREIGNMRQRSQTSGGSGGLGQHMTNPTVYKHTVSLTY